MKEELDLIYKSQKFLIECDNIEIKALKKNLKVASNLHIFIACVFLVIEIITKDKIWFIPYACFMIASFIVTICGLIFYVPVMIKLNKYITKLSKKLEEIELI